MQKKIDSVDILERLLAIIHYDYFDYSFNYYYIIAIAFFISIQRCTTINSENPHGQY